MLHVAKVWPDFHPIEKRKADTVITPPSFFLSLSLFWPRGELVERSAPTKVLYFPVCLRASCLHFPCIEGSFTLRPFPTSFYSFLDTAHRNSWQLTDSPLSPTFSCRKRGSKWGKLVLRVCRFSYPRNVLTTCILNQTSNVCSALQLASVQPSLFHAWKQKFKTRFSRCFYQSSAQMQWSCSRTVTYILYFSLWHNLSVGDIDFHNEFLIFKISWPLYGSVATSL